MSWRGAGTALAAALMVGLPGVAGAQTAATPPDSTAKASTPARQAPQAWPPLRTSWTSDRAPLRVGDVVTILIDDRTTASADKNEVATQQRDRNLSLRAGSGINPTSGGALRTGNDVSDRTAGESTHTQRFTAAMSARVTEITPDGTVHIEGVKKVQIDKHQQTVTVRGWIRAQDVTMNNTVDSERIADAEILFGTDGSLGKSRGIWTKLLNLIIP